MTLIIYLARYSGLLKRIQEACILYFDWHLAELLGAADEKDQMKDHRKPQSMMHKKCRRRFMISFFSLLFAASVFMGASMSSFSASADGNIAFVQSSSHPSFRPLRSVEGKSDQSQKRQSSLDTTTSTLNGEYTQNDVGKKKRLVIIRHGCTYMNEYLSKPGCQWGDAGFTDVFPPDVRDAYYRDTPLSPLGIQQAERLSRRLGNLVGQRSAGADVDMNLSLQDQNILNDLELIAVSPLTRALQTLELGLIPHVLHKKNPLNASPQKIKDDGSLLPMDENNTNEKGTMPKVVALPLASERVYLISDAGNSPATLAKQFPYVDFESEMMVRNKEEWWFTPENEDNYVEWRPIGQGQRYASYGEPDGEFQGRMTKLYDWLDARPESTIALICHWGVINWLLGHDFENCEMKVVSFDALRRQGFQSPL